MSDDKTDWDAASPTERNAAWAKLDETIQQWLLKVSEYSESDAFDAFVEEIRRGDYDEWLDLLTDEIADRAGDPSVVAAVQTPDVLKIGTEYKTPDVNRGRYSGCTVKITRKGIRGVWYGTVTQDGPHTGMGGSMVGNETKIVPDLVPRLTEWKHHPCPGPDVWDDVVKTMRVGKVNCTTGPGAKPHDIESDDPTARCWQCRVNTEAAIEHQAEYEKEKAKADAIANAVAASNARRRGVVDPAQPKAALKAPATTDRIVPVAGRRRVRRGG